MEVLDHHDHEHQLEKQSNMDLISTHTSNIAGI